MTPWEATRDLISVEHDQMIDALRLVMSDEELGHEAGVFGPVVSEDLGGVLDLLPTLSHLIIE